MKRPAKELTEQQIEFVKKNRLKMSANTIGKELGLSMYIINSYLKKNKLSLSKDEIRTMRIAQNSMLMKQAHQPDEQPRARQRAKDFWNMRVNPITYY
jgi:hypothetical protein